MKGFSTILMAAALTLSAATLYAGPAPSAREGLTARDDVRLLYAVDETHSFVIGSPSLLSAHYHGAVLVYGADKREPLVGYMVEHRVAQPLVYKNPVVSARALAEGPVTLAGADAAVDLYQLAYNACSGAEAAATFVIPRTFGSHKRLASVTAAEAFNYILREGEVGSWFISCDGASAGAGRFTVEKDYRSPTGGVETARVRFGSALPAINYVHAGEAPAPRVVAASDKK